MKALTSRSRKPSLVIRPTRARVRVSSAWVATVNACTMRSMTPGRNTPAPTIWATPSRMARLIVEGQGVAVLPTALMKAEIDSGLIRVLPTKMPLASGTMVVAHSGPAHRYRLLNRMIIKALNESGLMEPL